MDYADLLTLAATGSTANIAPLIFIGVIAVLVSLLLNNAGNRKALYLIDSWAQSCTYTIVSCERRYFRTGPFFFGASKYQRVFYLHVKDRDGRERKGWLKVGSYWTGMMNSEEFEVIWDE